MTKVTKEEYKQLKRSLEEIVEAKVSTYCLPVYDSPSVNGVTIVVAPTLGDSKSCRMVAVSVSYCMKDDKFSKRTGKYLAMQKMLRAEYVQMPLGPGVLKDEYVIDLHGLAKLFVV